MDIAKLALEEESIDSFIARPELGPLNFEDIRPDLLFLQSIVELIKTVDQDTTPKSIYDELQRVRTSYEALFNRVRVFSVAVDNPKAQRSEIINGVIDAVGQSLTRSILLLNAVTTLGGNSAFSKKIEESRRQLTLQQLETAEQVAHLKRRIPEIIAEAEQAAKAAQESAARTGVSVHEADFSAEVEALDRARLRWLIAAAVLALSAVGIATYLTDWAPRDAAPLWFAQRLATKVFIVGAVTAAAIWCGSIYRSLSHQRTVNQHRMNALRTFKTFVSAAETAEVRQAILLETTRTIFGAAPTGYLQSSESNVDAGSKMAEALSKAGKSSAGS